MLTTWARAVLDRAGLKGPARSLRLFLSGNSRRFSVGPVAVELSQRDFGDFIELNQVEVEDDAIAGLLAEVEPDDVFLDVGSNLGVYGVTVGSLLGSGTVVAVEPVRATVEKLAENLDTNGVDATVCPVAFSDEEGVVSMTVPDSHGSASLSEDGTTTVRRVCGDRYLTDNGLPAPTVVKIDVEGHETAAIRGLESTLTRPRCRLVYCEVHSVDTTEPSDLDGDAACLLREYGFEIGQGADLPGDRLMLRCERP